MAPKSPPEVSKLRRIIEQTDSHNSEDAIDGSELLSPYSEWIASHRRVERENNTAKQEDSENAKAKDKIEQSYQNP